MSDTPFNTSGTPDISILLNISHSFDCNNVTYNIPLSREDIAQNVGESGKVSLYLMSLG